LKGQDSNEKFKLYGNLEELKAWRKESKTKLDKARVNLSKIDEGGLSEEQKELLKLFKGEIKSVKIQVKDLKDIYTLKQGSAKVGAKKILIKHYGEEKTGGLEELLGIKEVIKKGEINLNSLEIKGDILRYGYDYEKDGVKLRVVVDEFKEGKKIFDYYSDRNFNHYEQGGYKPDLPTPNESIAENNKALDDYEKMLTKLYDEHDELELKSETHTLNKTEQERLNLLKGGLIPQYETLIDQEIHTLVSQKITKYNHLLKDLKDSFNNNPQKFNDIYPHFQENIDALIEILKRDREKIGIFIHQLDAPLKNDNEVHGAAIKYKGKKLKNGLIKVTGGGISEAQMQKNIRLSEMEQERLHLAFAREYNMQGFINDRHRKDFFARLNDAVRKYHYKFHLDLVDYKKYLYSQDRILESDNITQAKQKLEKEREAFQRFLEQSAIKEANKELKSDLLDKTKPLRKAEKEELERQIPFIEAEIQKYEAKTARLDERIKKTQTRIQPYLDEINALQKQYDELYFTETRGEEANAKKWLKLDEIKAKQEELRKPYNDALFKFIHPYQRLKGKAQTEIQKLKFGLQDRAERLEEIQNEALTNKAQKAWLETFGLKSMEEAYTPKFSKEVKEALEPVLKGEEIKLTKGSFDKLLKRNREEFLPFIKETLENADAVVKQADGALIFAKDYRDERLGKFFASVSRNDEGEWVITSNAPKTLNNLKNKIEEGGELLYSDLPELPIIAKPELSAEALNGEANLNESIPQNSKIINPQTQDLRKRLKEQINQQVEIYRTLRDEAEKKIRERIGEILENNPKYASRLTRYNIKNLHKKITEQKRQKINLEEVRKVQGLIREMKALWKEADNLENFKKQDGEKKNPSPLEKEYYKLESLRSEYGRELEKEVERLEGLEIKHPQEYNYLLALEDEMISPYSEFSWENTRNSRENIRNKMQEYIYKETAKALNLKYFKTKESLLRPLNLYWDQLDGVFELIGERLGVKSESVKIFRPIYPKIRKAIEKHLNLKPLEEFGTNYAEFYRDGKGAVKKLIREAEAFKENGEKGEYKGQVAGAFYKEGLGDIDLVWGEITDLEKHKGYGLAHILDKHPKFDVFKIPQIIEQGEIQKTYNGYNVVTNDYIVGLNKGFKDKDGKVINDSNVWVVTSFEPQIKGKKGASSIASVTSNYNEPMPHKPLEGIIPQKSINSAMEKSSFDEKKALNSEGAILKEKFERAKNYEE
ncbi:PBECR2 nuclease fold domain-containing protein, partial [Campylobacter felis]|nr:PBECR2 nuclease fold domain-containing protein [Campylobacter felis]